MSNLHKPGNYLAHLVDSDLIKSAKGDPVVMLKFEYMEENGELREIPWFGSMNGGAKPITVETMVRLGFKGMKLEQVTEGKDMFACENAYEIVIANENNPSKGVVQSKVKYINIPGESGFRQKMSKEDAISLCAGMNIGADLMEARSRGGKKTTVQGPPKIDAPTITDSELGF